MGVNDMKDIRLNKLAKLLVNYSTKVKKGDFVLITCEDVAKPWMIEAAREAIKAGAHVETILGSAELHNVIMNNSTKEQLLADDYLMTKAMEKADVWLSAWGTINTKINTNVDSEKIKNLTQGATSWRKLYSSKMGDESLRWCGTQFPTHANAQEASMSSISAICINYYLSAS